MQVTWGCSGSELEDHIAAENITSSKAASKRSSIAGEALARPSQVSATAAWAALTTGCRTSSSAASSWACWAGVATGWVPRLVPAAVGGGVMRGR